MGVQHSKINPKDITDLVEETDFTESEIKTWYKSFIKNCPSGKLTLKGFQNLYQKLFPNGDSSTFAKYVFRSYDSNGDGTVDFREFMTALSINKFGSLDSKLDWLFNIYDQDSDGFITKDEMLRIISAMYKMVGEKMLPTLVKDCLTPEERTDQIFRRIDKDGDQTLTLSEFKTTASQDSNLMTLINFGSSH